MASDQPVITIIDDDVSFREALTGLINSYGFSTATFVSAHEFLGSDLRHLSACLIVDIRMPHVGGLELPALLAASGRMIPIVFMTSYPDEETRVRALASGALGFLSKPLDHDKLLFFIRTAIGCASGN